MTKQFQVFLDLIRMISDTLKRYLLIVLDSENGKPIF